MQGLCPRGKLGGKSLGNKARSEAASSMLIGIRHLIPLAVEGCAGCEGGLDSVTGLECLLCCTGGPSLLHYGTFLCPSRVNPYVTEKAASLLRLSALAFLMTSSVQTSFMYTELCPGSPVMCLGPKWAHNAVCKCSEFSLCSQEARQMSVHAGIIVTTWAPWTV